MADAPDSLIVSGPDFEQKTPQQFLVTPTGRPQTTLAQALADSSGSVTVVNVQGGPFLLAGSITTTGTVENSVASLTADGVVFGGGFGAVVAGPRATNAQLIVGQSSGIPVPRSVGGDLTMDNMAQFALVVSGVTAGTYGDATHVGQFEVDDTGRLLSAGNVAISAGTVTQIVVSAAPFLNIGTITSAGTITAANLAGQRLLGNATTVAAIPTGITIGANLALSTDGTLSATGGGSVSSVIAGSGLAGGTITSTGTISLATQAKSTLLGNAGTATAVPSAVAIGSGLSLSVAGTLTATGSGGSVTSVIAQGGPFLTNGTITGAGTITNAVASLTASAILLGAGTSAVTALGSLGTTTTVLHGNAAGAPTFGAVSLSADVTGNLPVTNLASGTGATSSTFWRGDGAWGTPAGAGDVVGPASAVDGHLALFNGTTGKLIKDGGTPATGSVTSVATGALLTGGPVTATGTISVAAAAASTLIGNATTASAVPTAVPIGSGLAFSSGTLTATGSGGSVTSVITAAGPFLANTTITSSGTITGAATTLTNHGVLVGQATAAPVATAVGTDGQVLLGQSAADPAWGTMSGDAAITKAGVLNMTSVVAGATVGSASLIPVVTYDTKGRITATTTAAVPVTAAGVGAVLNSGTVSINNSVTLTGTAAGTVTIAPTTGTSDVIVNLPSGGGTVTVAAAPSFARQRCEVDFKQGATASVVTLNSGFVFGTSGGPTSYTAGTVASSVDRLMLLSPDGTKWAVMAINQGFTV